MGIYKKLLEIQKSVIGLAKDGKGYSYKYVTANKLLDYIKPLMNEQGLLLKQEMVNMKNEVIKYQSKNSEKTEVLYSIEYRFTWIDVETGEQDVNSFFSAGMNDFEKGVGSSASYAERFFIMKYFHIASDENDDIDNPKRKEEEVENKKEKNRKKAIEMIIAEMCRLSRPYDKRDFEKMNDEDLAILYKNLKTEELPKIKEVAPKEKEVTPQEEVIDETEGKRLKALAWVMKDLKEKGISFVTEEIKNKNYDELNAYYKEKIKGAMNGSSTIEEQGN